MALGNSEIAINEGWYAPLLHSVHLLEQGQQLDTPKNSPRYLRNEGAKLTPQLLYVATICMHEKEHKP